MCYLLKPLVIEYIIKAMSVGRSEANDIFTDGRSLVSSSRYRKANMRFHKCKSVIHNLHIVFVFGFTSAVSAVENDFVPLFVGTADIKVRTTPTFDFLFRCLRHRHFKNLWQFVVDIFPVGRRRYDFIVDFHPPVEGLHVELPILVPVPVPVLGGVTSEDMSHHPHEDHRDFPFWNFAKLFL